MIGIIQEKTLPPSSEERLLFKIVARVADDVPEGTVIQVYPTNGPGGEGVRPYGLKNEFAYRGDARYASLLPRRLKKGAVNVKSSPTTLDFLRADANVDGKVNISDPIFVIRYLFVNDRELECADAADMNDDGSVDVADAIFGLTYLFRGPESGGPFSGNSIGKCGRDTTPDDLPACTYNLCP